MFDSLFWAVILPLLLLVYYYRRVAAASLLELLLCFGLGALSGLVALSLEFGFEYLSSWLEWETRSLAEVALRQLAVIGPIEEGCKLGGVLLFCQLSRRRDRDRPVTIYMLAIAIALGFTAEENWIYLANGTASILDRAIGTPVHAMFATPWGYALARNRRIAKGWMNAVVCHALVNTFSSAWRYPPPLSFLSYGLFPFLLWMFWRLEALLRRVQDLSPIILISGLTPIYRYWQLGLVLFVLMLGGNALFGLFLLARNVSALTFSQLFYPDVLWFIFSRGILNLVPGLLAWGIYWYLRSSANRRC